MRKASPNKTFIPAAPEKMGGEADTCGCSTCPYMKLNTLEKVYACLRDMTPEVEMPSDLIEAALLPIQRMVAIG